MIKNELKPTELKTADFHYDLPEELIAQHPSEKRDEARLMVLDREKQTVEHRIFRDITEYLHEGDGLVINDSKVIPARIYGEKINENGGEGAKAEFVLLRQKNLDTWETLVNLYSILDEIGKMPLPPYIKEALRDKSRYQTVYAREEGSAAAPTAGLHFTTELLDKIKAMGVEIAPVMLHIGLGTFRPVKVESITDHHMHTEFFSITEESAEKINRARANGGRIVAVGTTSCRVLESASDEDGIVHATEDDTGIFIYPGYKFKAVDALITNFHLPESTLLMLVSALAGKDYIMRAYKEAVDKGYKFFSFGDAMLIE